MGGGGKLFTQHHVSNPKTSQEKYVEQVRHTKPFIVSVLITKSFVFQSLMDEVMSDSIYSSTLVLLLAY